jgi:hypothetical protein
MSRLSSLGPEQQVVDVTSNVRGSSVGTGHTPRALDHPIVSLDDAAHDRACGRGREDCAFAGLAPGAGSAWSRRRRVGRPPATCSTHGPSAGDTVRPAGRPTAGTPGGLLGTLLAGLYGEIGDADLFCRLWDRDCCTRDDICPVGQAEWDRRGERDRKAARDRQAAPAVGTLLALVSATCCGLSDYFGGLLARRAHFLTVALAGQLAASSSPW